MHIHLETSSVFKLLLQKVKEEGKTEFTIDRYRFVFRYSTVKTGILATEEIQIPKLDSNILDEDVESLAFDVFGLYDKYLTQVEVLRDKIYIIPERSKERVEMFQMILNGETTI